MTKSISLKRVFLLSVIIAVTAGVFLITQENTFAKERTVTYKASKDGDVNYKMLNKLLKSKDKLTLIIPSGTKMYVNGPLLPKSNKTIIAKGAQITMKKKTFAIFTQPNYKVKNLTVKGGKWISSDKGGRAGSMFQIAHASNVVLEDIESSTHWNGHTIEIIASKNVTVRDCKIRAKGKNPKNCKEEQIQIDIAAKKTAPKVAEFGKKYVKGQTCSNISIIGNDVVGARAVGVNYYKGYKNKYHHNIDIKDNKLLGTTSEAIQYYNVVNGTISDNSIRTNATRKQNNNAYNIALHLQNNGVCAALKGSLITIKNNVIYGNRNGIYMKAFFNSNESKALGQYDKVIVKDNKVYCKHGEYHAISMTRGSVNNYIEEDNKCAEW